MEGFEPSRRDYWPAAFRERSLQPLGYISLYPTMLLYTKTFILGSSWLNFFLFSCSRPEQLHLVPVPPPVPLCDLPDGFKKGGRELILGDPPFPVCPYGGWGVDAGGIAKP